MRLIDEGERNRSTGVYFPTRMATALARKVNLYPIGEMYDYEGSSEKRKKRKMAQINNLKWFQEISMGGDLETAMVAYIGKTLTEEQEKVLELIHSFTSLQARGHLTNEVFNKIEKGCESKDLKSLGDLLIALQGGNDEGGKIAKGIEAFVVHTTRRE